MLAYLLPPHRFIFFILEFDKCDEEINKLRNQLKEKVIKLNDAEKKKDLKGFHLNPLTQEEMKALHELMWLKYQQRIHDYYPDEIWWWYWDIMDAITISQMIFTPRIQAE